MNADPDPIIAVLLYEYPVIVPQVEITEEKREQVESDPIYLAISTRPIEIGKKDRNPRGK